MELFRDFAADTLRDLDAFVKCHAADGDKRNHVRRADSRMLALVLREINMAQRDFDAAHGGPTDRLGRTYDGDDRPIVIRVHFPPEQIDTADRSDRAHDRVHNFRPSSFAEIRHAFHDFVHKNLLSRFAAALTVAALYERRFFLESTNTGGHRPPLQYEFIHLWQICDYSQQMCPTFVERIVLIY